MACGCSQIPGVDFTDNYSPVIHDATHKILIVLQMILQLESRIVDVETTFLHGDLEGAEIHVDCSEGLDGGSPTEYLKLEKIIHGLVQSSRVFLRSSFLSFKMLVFTKAMQTCRSLPNDFEIGIRTCFCGNLCE